MNDRISKSTELDALLSRRRWREPKTGRRACVPSWKSAHRVWLGAER